MKGVTARFPTRLVLVKGVKVGLSQRRFHVLWRDELREVYGLSLSGSRKLEDVHPFAAHCHAECEMGLDFAAARFVPKRFTHLQLASFVGVRTLQTT